jgi:hypothetical protein
VTAQDLLKNRRLLLLLLILFVLVAILAIILLLTNQNKTNSGSLNNPVKTSTSSAKNKTSTSSATTGGNGQTNTGGNKSSGTSNGTSGTFGTPTPPAFVVTAASVGVNPTSYQFWDCATNTFTFNFTGSITTNGVGDVTYYWVRQTDPPMLFRSLGSKTAHFNAAGTQLVTLPWSWTGTNSLSTPPADNNPWTYIGTATLHITSPNAFTPNPASASYTVTDPRCVP